MSNIREFPVKCPGTFQPCTGKACPIWKVVEGNECPVASNADLALKAVREAFREAATYLDVVGLSALFKTPRAGDPPVEVDWKTILEDLASLEE